ncbi:MAG: phytanoyl-CoA dioxygenase family protein [Hymenobacter sp.]
MNLWRADEGVRRFVLARRFARLAADLLGVENVRIYHDQALFKEPGGGPTPWHQDQYYWPVDTTNTITMWMPLVDIDVAMGMLTFASGSHRQGACSTTKSRTTRPRPSTTTCGRRAFRLRRRPPCGPATRPGTTATPSTRHRAMRRGKCAR